MICTFRRFQYWWIFFGNKRDTIPFLQLIYRLHFTIWMLESIYSSAYGDEGGGIQWKHLSSVIVDLLQLGYKWRVTRIVILIFIGPVQFNSIIGRKWLSPPPPHTHTHTPIIWLFLKNIDWYNLACLVRRHSRDNDHENRNKLDLGHQMSFWEIHENIGINSLYIHIYDALERHCGWPLIKYD